MARDSVIRFYVCACMCVCMRKCARVYVINTCVQVPVKARRRLELQAVDSFLT